MAVLLSAGTSACSTANSVSSALFGSAPAEGAPGHVSGFLGGVVADEPRAALAGREVLSSGGNAADAAVAVALTLSVTLPSRAGLGGGGACLAFAPAKNSINAGVPEAVLFLPATPSGRGGDRPAAVPMVARGLFALHARYGKRPFESLIAPAEQLARFGVPASRALIRDLTIVAAPLAGDPASSAIFLRNGAPLAEGDPLVQADLGATLAQLRVSGVGDFYQGAMARRITDAATQAGGILSAGDLRAALPQITPPISVPYSGGTTLAFLPPPADGGLAAASAFRVLRSDPSAFEAASARAAGTTALWRINGGDPAAVLAAEPPAASLPPLPASTTFATLDRDGNAVVCAETMNNLFGTGRIAPGTGIVLAASPAAVSPPLLSAALAWNGNVRAFRAAVGGSGQGSAAAATAFALAQALADRANPPSTMPIPAPEPGRANVIECNRLLPEESASCAWNTDPRGAGLAVGSN